MVYWPTYKSANRPPRTIIASLRIQETRKEKTVKERNEKGGKKTERVVSCLVFRSAIDNELKVEVRCNYQ